MSLSVDAPLPAVQTVTFSNVLEGTFTLRVMADALGGAIDVTTAAILSSADETTVATALEAAGTALVAAGGAPLGTVGVTTPGTLVLAFGQHQ